ncbi:MAG: hypothetical protein NTW21_07190 [Verrucomicrobia bacterium]|nr:hypothetical protein [Verrucomicrobiota bacterium]
MRTPILSRLLATTARLWHLHRPYLPLLTLISKSAIAALTLPLTPSAI